MAQNSLSHSHPTHVDIQTTDSPPLHTDPPPHLLVPGWQPRAWPPRLQLGALSGPVYSHFWLFPFLAVCVSVCLSVSLSPALPSSSPLTPLLTCPPAPDEQSIWNVTVLPNSKWANITWKHNFGPGTDFVVEYIDSKHCCAGWWRRRRPLQRAVQMPLKRACELPQAQGGLSAWLDCDLMKLTGAQTAVGWEEPKGKEGDPAAISELWGRMCWGLPGNGALHPLPAQDEGSE